jgi:hypothetical protein
MMGQVLRLSLGTLPISTVLMTMACYTPSLELSLDPHQAWDSLFSDRVFLAQFSLPLFLNHGFAFVPQRIL